LIKTAQDHGAPLRIIETTTAVNEQRKRAMARKVASTLGGAIRGKTIALLGLTFKPNTDDMREAPSIALITGLQDLGAVIRAYEPAGVAHAKAILSDLTYCDGPTRLPPAPMRSSSSRNGSSSVRSISTVSSA